MFRDRDEELQRLNRQLLEEEESEKEQKEWEAEDEEAYEDENAYEEEDAYEDEDAPDYDAYNGDASDVDLEAYSQQIYEGSQKSPVKFVALLFLLAAAGLLLIALLIAYQRGLL